MIKVLNLKSKTATVAALFAISMILCTSCNDDNNGSNIGDVGGNGNIPDNKLTISIENGSQYSSLIDKVHLIVHKGGDSGEETSLTNTNYGDGNFTVNLPATVEANWLLPLSNLLPSGVTVSNNNAKATQSVRLETQKGDNFVHEIYYKTTDNSTSAELVYSDSDCSLGGTYKFKNQWEDFVDGERITIFEEGTYSYSGTLKKGWNFVFYIVEEKTKTPVDGGIKIVGRGKATTTDPGGMKWVMYGGK